MLPDPQGFVKSQKYSSSPTIPYLWGIYSKTLGMLRSTLPETIESPDNARVYVYICM
jgi:hypothetical protein